MVFFNPKGSQGPATWNNTLEQEANLLISYCIYINATTLFTWRQCILATKSQIVLVLGGKYIKEMKASSLMKMNSFSELCTVITQMMVSAAQFTKTALSTQTGCILSSLLKILMTRHEYERLLLFYFHIWVDKALDRQVAKPEIL